MKYDGYLIGPVLRRIRKERQLTVDDVCELTGLSNSSISQLEQGGRNMSMNALYLFMAAYKVDANTLLDIKNEIVDESIDNRLQQLPDDKRHFFVQSFQFMLDQAW